MAREELCIRPTKQRGCLFWIACCIRDGFLRLFNDVVFCSLKVFGMGFAPFQPDGNQQCLEYSCNRRSQECPRDAKEFGPSDQRGEGDHGVQANGLPDDARPYDITLEHVDDDEVDQHDDGDDPLLGQSEQHTDRTGNKRSQHRNEL